MRARATPRDVVAAGPMLLISAERLRSLVSPAAAIDAVRDAFIDLSAGRIEQPTRLVVGGGNGLGMLARAAADGTMVLKGVAVRGGSAAAVPALHALVVLFDGPTGAPTAVIEGATLTALRTGAASGVATDLLAPPAASVMALVGAGGQAADQVRAVCAVRPIREVRIASRDAAHASALATRLLPELPGVRVVAASSVRAAIDSADVVCTVTNARVPLFEAGELAAGAHVNAIGAHTPDLCELPPELFERAAVVAVDRRDAALAEAGDLLRALRGGFVTEDRLLELGELLADGGRRGDGTAGGGRGDAPTIFKSVGVAAQDLALARLAVQRALESGSEIPQFDA